MADKLNITLKQGNKDQKSIIEVVACPMTEVVQPARICVKCPHLRIIEEHFVKCNYRIDRKREIIFNFKDYDL